MAKQKKVIDMDKMIDMLVRQIGSMSKKKLKEWLKNESDRLGLDMKSKYRKTKMSIAKKKYTEENYPHYQPAKVVRKFTLRITLKDIRPSIWRKVEVPSNITLRHLAELILPLMGWAGYHLHQFFKDDVAFFPAYKSDEYDEVNVFSLSQHYPSEEYVIADILCEKGKSVIFEYDLGNDWKHEIRLSSVADYAAEEPHRIKFIGGERACPPEDIDGILEYQELCEEEPSMKGMSKEYREMCKAGFIKPRREDPNCFDPEEFDAERAAQICERFNESPLI